MEFFYLRISALKGLQNNVGERQSRYGTANKIIKIFDFSRVSPGNKPLAKEPEDSAYAIERPIDKFFEHLEIFLKTFSWAIKFFKHLWESKFQIFTFASRDSVYHSNII